MPRPTASRAPRASDQVVGWVAILAGVALAFAVQVLAPVGVPLYDGVVVQEPYRFLHPAGVQAGSPTSFAATVDVAGAGSPQVTAATLESPPQAQLIALPGAFTLAGGVTSLDVSVTPIDPPAVPAGGQIAGNVYRISVTDQAGAAVAIKPCDGCISLVMRAPEDSTGEARLQRYTDGAWSDVETVHAGTLGMYATNPIALGDYAIVSGGSPGGPGNGLGTPEPGVLAMDQVVVAGAAAVILVLLFVAAVVVRGRRPSKPAPSHAGEVRSRSRAISSKRKRPTKPPSGRPER